jgi:hypothetical protein
VIRLPSASLGLGVTARAIDLVGRLAQSVSRLVGPGDGHTHTPKHTHTYVEHRCMLNTDPNDPTGPT